jgi:hypothetical protein
MYFDNMADSEQEEQQAQVQGKKGQKAKFPCIRCKNNVAKNSKSVRCGTCLYWVHTECENISAELYNVLAHPEKFGGLVTWTCDSCVAGNARIEQVVKAYAEKMKNVEERLTGNEQCMREMGSEMKKMNEKLQERDVNVEKAVKKGENNVLDELREREVRKRNVVLYRVAEHENERAAGAERADWDRKMCLDICEKMDMEMEDDDIRFCRRVGERGEWDRPLVMGLYSEETKYKILRRARKLEKTEYRDVSITQDLTKRQREEEGEMVKEAERRNENLSEEDRAKNVQWAVVGAKGEKRMVKTAAREYTSARGRGSQRGRGPTRGGGPSQPTRGRGRPPNSTRQEGERSMQVRRTRSEDPEEAMDVQPPGKK